MNRTPARNRAISTPSQQPLTAESSYPPIADYAAIGDGRTVALVSREGAIEWLCLPHFSAPSVFAAILDRGSGGMFAISPERAQTITRRYIDDTNVLETTFSTTTGVVRVTDFMPMPADPHRLEPMREVLRIVEGIEGNVTLRVIVDPRPDYGRRRARPSRANALGWTWSWGNELLTLKTDAPLHLSPGANATALDARVTIAAGSKYSFSLCYAKGDIGCSAPLGAAAEQRLASTLEWWKQWARRCSYDGPYRSAVIRSALALKLMTYSLSGGVIAAPTTSLPEALGGNRNWDYRYCWMRDAALTMRAFTDLGFMEEARAFFAWLLHTTRLTWPKLQVLYDVHGRTDVPEFELSHWEGYARSKPVRIGNGAAEQLQLDTYGGVLSAALDYVRSGGEVQADEAKLLAGFGRSVLEALDAARQRHLGNPRRLPRLHAQQGVVLGRTRLSAPAPGARSHRRRYSAHTSGPRGDRARHRVAWFQHAAAELRADLRWRSSGRESAAHGVPGLQGPERPSHARYLRPHLPTAQPQWAAI